MELAYYPVRTRTVNDDAPSIAIVPFRSSAGGRIAPLQPVQVAGQIDVLQLRAAMREREERHRSSFAAVLERCYARIRRCASVMRTDCTFEIPPFLPGLPLYDTQLCSRFVVSHLRRNGFDVLPERPGSQLQRAPIIHISWHPMQQEEESARDEELMCSVERTPQPHQPQQPQQQQQQQHQQHPHQQPRPITEFRPSRKFILRG